MFSSKLKKKKRIKQEGNNKNKKETLKIKQKKTLKNKIGRKQYRIKQKKQ